MTPSILVLLFNVYEKTMGNACPYFHIAEGKLLRMKLEAAVRKCSTK